MEKQSEGLKTELGSMKGNKKSAEFLQKKDQLQDTLNIINEELDEICELIEELKPSLEKVDYGYGPSEEFSAAVKNYKPPKIMDILDSNLLKSKIEDSRLRQLREILQSTMKNCVKKVDAKIKSSKSEIIQKIR